MRKMRPIDADKLLEEYGKYDIGFAVNAQDTLDAIIIPEGATNGNVQKIILADFEFEHHGDTVIGIRYAPYCKVQFDIRWWNAPYERGVDK